MWKYTMSDPLSMTLSALADPTRRAILDRLAEGEATVTDLARPFQLSQPAISKHLKVLEAAGLISQGRAAQSRPRKLEAAPLKLLSEWMDRYRQHWDASFDQLDQYLTELQRTKSGVDGHE
jgi:DNA-binding transcriptional ArsR family regulator